MGCSCSRKTGAQKEENSIDDQEDTEQILEVTEAVISENAAKDTLSSSAPVKEALFLDLNGNEPAKQPPVVVVAVDAGTVCDLNESSTDSPTPREDIGCQTTEPLPPPHIISDGKLLNGYYPKFSPIHVDFLKAKSLEAFLLENNIPLSNGVTVNLIDSPTKSIGSGALEVICEETSERTSQKSITISKPDTEFKHIDSECEEDDDDNKTLNSNFTLSVESIGTAYYSISRASSYQTSLDFLSSEWNINEALRKQIFIADI